MSIEKTTYMLSNMNAILGSGLTYQQRLQDGAPLGAATTEFGLNILNGGMRNEIARDIRRTTGSNMGYLVNSLAGYGTEEANYKGTAGLMGASLFTSMLSPRFGCGSYFGGPMMFGGGIFGGGMFGGCGCNSMINPYFGGGSFFARGGFWC